MNNDICKVTVEYGDKEKVLTASCGDTLSQTLSSSGISYPSLCAGKGICKKCTVLVDGEKKLACRFVVERDIRVVLPQRGRIKSVSGANETGGLSGRACLAFDIGTTTLALALFSPESGEIARVVTADNPQSRFGADIMTRIEFCRVNGAGELNKEIIGALNRMLCELAEEFDLSEVDRIYAAGNTTMLHLFLGVDCSEMGVSPYVPAFLGRQLADCQKLGVELNAQIETVPCISAFVGGDIYAGLNCIELPADGGFGIFIDLGTNAEIVLFSNKEATCTAAAAGPCFEGAGISCGMAALGGAINSFRITHGKAEFSTVGDLPACGICGTGLIDAAAQLFKAGVIDETGFMESERFDILPDVYISGRDIRQLQLAKSAVRSAVDVLLKKAGANYTDVEALYISGGFSAQMNPISAAEIGLIPAELSSKCLAVNNSSLLGTVKYACGKCTAEEFSGVINFVDLAADIDFARLFADNMCF